MNEKTVLIVEDNELNLKLTKTLLKMGGYLTLEAMDAETGISLAHSHHPDLILMDVQLPGMDGLAATRVLKSDPALMAIPVIALTGCAMHGDEAIAKAAGCDAYLTKPMDGKLFMETLERFVGGGAESVCHLPESICGHRILIVDDDPINVKLLAAKLATGEYEIFKAYGGVEALGKIRKVKPDLILLDIMMPDLDGYEVTKRLKAEPETSTIPIILVTALNGLEDKKMGMEAGADEFLNKPVNDAELKARVLSLLRLREYREQLNTRRASESSLLKKVGMEVSVESTERRATVLVVEDHDQDMRLITSYLASLPCRLLLAHDGSTALEIVQKEAVDVMLLDVMLPDLDGFEVCRRIKEKDETRPIQVIMVTGLRDMESKIRGIGCGTDDYLVKPVNREELQVRIRALINKKRYLDGLRAKIGTAMRTAITDKLTDLYNYGYFRHFLELELKRSRRQGHSLALLMIDVDNFKAFNDTYGHPAGDEALREIARLIRSSIREIDLAARYGGEEFAVVLPYGDRNVASTVASRILQALQAQTFFCESPSIPPCHHTVSIGVSIFPLQASSMEELIQSADAALYRAKKRGKMQVCLWDE